MPLGLLLNAAWNDAGVSVKPPSEAKSSSRYAEGRGWATALGNDSWVRPSARRPAGNHSVVINLALLSRCGQNDATIGPPGVLRGDGRMYVFLLILGAVIAAAGVVLIGPGLPFGGRDYDASIVTPGAVAIVGGLILIGLALAVRVLSRIEKALAARPLSQPVLPEPVLQEEAGIGAP